jgi:hypothetical protein
MSKKNSYVKRVSQLKVQAIKTNLLNSKTPSEEVKD